MPPASESLAGSQIEAANFKSRPRKFMSCLFQNKRLSRSWRPTSGQQWKEAIPSVSRIGVLYDSYGRRQLEAAENAARSLRIQIVPIELEPPYDYNEWFRVAKQKKVAAMILLYSAAFYPARDSIARQAVANHLPAIAYASEFARAGLFASYGSNAVASFGRLAYFIDRVLQGLAPKDLPVEQPTKLEMVINLRTAKALGLTVAPSMLARADEIIR